MKTVKKRSISIILTAVLCLALLPMSALGASVEFVVDSYGELWGYNGPGGDVVIPYGATHINEQAFRNNTSITSITIPSSVTKIGSQAFIGCTNLTIYGVSGSVAQEAAQRESVPFTAIASTAPTPTPPAGNTPSSWAQSGVTAAISAGLVPSTLQNGYSQAMTRAEFCALVVTLYEQIRGEITGRRTFSDTNDINVQKAAAIGVVDGTGSGRFSPLSTLTREQAATMLARLAEAIGTPLAVRSASFADNSSIASWARGAVGQVQAAGIMSGTGSNRFSPKGTYTREQGIVTILRLYDAVMEEAFSKPPQQEIQPLPAPVTVLPSFESITLSDSLKRGMTESELRQAFDGASAIAAKYLGQSREDQLRGVFRDIRLIFETEITYSMTEKHYNTAYGYFVAGVASCAGSVRATGLVLTILGFSYEHVNENQASHQWPRVNLDGAYWIVDAFGLYVGPEPAPYSHPWF